MHFYSFSTFLLIGGDIVDLVKETGAVAQAVLLFLLVFSLISWSIILSKWSAIRRARVQSGRFLRAFRRAQRLQDVAAVSEQFLPSPFVGGSQSGFIEFDRRASSSAALLNLLPIQRALQMASSEQ